MILISGATGFLGSHLLKCLCLQDKKQTIRALYRSETKKKYTLHFLKNVLPELYHNRIDAIDWFNADILNIPELDNAYQNIKKVYHCAALIGNNASYYAVMKKVNIEGTANMVNLAISHKVQKFCHVSSIAALGKYVDKNNVDENASIDSEYKLSIYSLTKYGAELEAWRASQENLNICIVNPGVILGSGFFNQGSGMIFKKVIQNTKFYIPKKTGFVYIDDVTNTMIQLMESSIKNERYILVSENTSFKTVMQSIAHVFSKKKPTIKVGKFSLYILWFFQNIFSFFTKSNINITLSTIRNLHLRYEYNNQKSIKDLGIIYTPVYDAIVKVYNDYSILQKTDDQL